MKRIILLLTILVGTMTVQASLTPDPSPKGEGCNYSYLTFETTDGAKASVTVEGLTLTISGTTLTAGTKTFTLLNLSKMYFSTSNETTTGIENVNDNENDNYTDIYDLKGHKITKKQMRKGVYIVKTKQGIHKIVVR